MADKPNQSGVFKLIERADEAFKKKNWEYAVSNYLDVLRQKPDDYETRKKLLKTCQDRRAAGQAKAGPLDRLVYLERKKALTALGVLVLLALVSVSFLNGEGTYLGWMLALLFLGTAGGFAAASPWPRLLLWKKQGKARSAFDLTEKLLLKEPNHLDLLDAHAEAANESGLPEASLAACDWTLGFVPDYIPALRLAGALQHQHRKDIQKAQQLYHRILQITEDTDMEASRAIKNLAAEHTMQQGVEKAAVSGSYREMLSNTKAAEKLESQQRTLKTADEVEQAITYKKEELAKKPDDYRLWRDLGDLQKRLKAWADAEASYQKAIALEPVNATLKMKVGDLTLARYDDQILTLKMAIKANPADAETKAKAAQLEKEKYLFSSEEFAWRAKEHPTDANIRYEFGEALYRTGRTREAIAEFQFTVKDHKRKTQSLLRLGDCFRREGQLDLSAKQFERALEDLATMNEAKKAVLYALGDVCEKQGRLEDAKKAWDELYESDINYRDIAKRSEALATRLKAS